MSFPEDLPIEKRYVKYYDEVGKRWITFPRRKHQGQQIQRRNDWYCRKCGLWVDDDTPHVVCSNENCEDIWHLSCLGIEQSGIPEGDWFCPKPPGCQGSRRGPLPGEEEAQEPEENEEEDTMDGRTWHMITPLRVGQKEYQRVVCDSLGGKVYYAMNPFAYDALLLQGSIISSLILHNVGWPDRLRITAKGHPRDYERLRKLGFLGVAARTSLSSNLPYIPSNRIRVFVTFDAVRVILNAQPELQSNKDIMASINAISEAIKNDHPETLPEPSFIAPAIPETDNAIKASAAGEQAAKLKQQQSLKRSTPDSTTNNPNEDEDENDEPDAAGMMLNVLGELRKDIDAFKEALTTLHEDVKELHKKLEEQNQPKVKQQKQQENKAPAP